MEGFRRKESMDPHETWYAYSRKTKVESVKLEKTFDFEIRQLSVMF